MLDPLEAFEYWDFTFDDIGREDVVAMIDSIIALRNTPEDLGCSKVTVVTHSSGANQILVAAQDPTTALDTKVSKIVTIAPCLNININEFWLPLRDIASVQAFYAAMAQFGITNLFGPDTEAMIEPFCNAGGVYSQICNVYLRPAVMNTTASRSSLKNFAHIQ